MKALWELRPQLYSYAYWNRKAQFLLDEDTYDKWALFAVEEGQFAFHIGDVRGKAGAGDLVVCPPGVPFGRRVMSPLSFHVFQFDWRRETGGETTAGHSVDPAELGRLSSVLCGKPAVQDTDRLFSTFAHLRSLRLIGDRLRLDWAGHLLADIWLTVLTGQTKAPLEAGSRSVDALMDEAALYIRERAFAPLSLAKLAASLGLTPVQFSRRFQAAYRMTPSEYVIAIRLNKACALLAGSDLSLDEIAERCGYQNGSYISRLFAAKLRMTPSEYRRANRV